MASLKIIKSIGVYSPVILIIIMHVYMKYDYLDMPLIGDEWYYANPNVFNNLSNWISISFGHPPGWNLLNGIIYSIVGYSPKVAHYIGLSCSMCSLLVLFMISKKTWSWPIAVFAIAAISNHDYFIKSNSLNHSVITAATCGILSLLFLYKKKFMIFAFFATLAFLFRESSLVFVLAGIIMQRDKKTLLWSLIPVLAIFVVYGWYYIETSRLMMNDAMRYNLQNLEPIWIFDFKHFISFYHYLYTWIHPFISIFILGIISFVILKLKKVNWLFIGFFTVFIFHSGFFAFYSMRVPRNSYFSTLAFIFAGCVMMSKLNKRHLSFLLLPVVLYTAVDSFQRIVSRTQHFDLHKQRKLILKEMVDYLHTLDLNQKRELIKASSWPLSTYLRIPYVGFVKKNIINYSEYSNRDDDPDVIIVDLGYMYHTHPRFLPLIESSAYRLAKTFQTENNEDLVHVYLKSISEK